MDGFVKGEMMSENTKQSVGEPVAWQDIVSAIRAVCCESTRHDEMFPQPRDKQIEDERAIYRVVKILERYATIATNHPHWPMHPAHPKKNEEIERLKRNVNDLSRVVHWMTVGQQAAWIEWKHGEGADAGMRWIHNGLLGPGLIPDEDEPYGKEAQAYFDANRDYPFPTCYCGRPSNIIWMGEGFCCQEHYNTRRAQFEAQQQAGQEGEGREGEHG
jgi:hypothetical protein